MNILLLGYGKMGKTIEKLAIERGHHIVGKIDIENRAELEALNKAEVDVAIEFSAPESAFENIKYCLEKGWPVVSGTTGWLKHKTAVTEICNKNKGAFFYASNYSIGVNLFFKLNSQLAKLMNGREYNTSMTEVHHVHKLDAPSGTAITLAEGIINEIPKYKDWKLAPNSIDSNISIKAERIREVPGTHSVKYESEVDSIEIIHTAHSREGFALGAVISGEWLPGKVGVFGMDDLLGEL